MSSGRAFRVERIAKADVGPKASHAVIECAACGVVEHLKTATGHTRLPDVAIEKNFRNKGWIVGTLSADDRCPDCARSKPMENKGAATAKSMADVVKAAAPRTLSPDDRRIIYEKLGDIYDDASGGYTAGWTDKRLAEDLNVPAAWVVEIREMFFGALKVNPEISAALATAEQLVVDARALVEDVSRHIDTARGLLSELGGRHKALVGRLDDLNRDMAAIKKAVLP